MIKLQRGSFRGIEFNFTDLSKSSGRKSIIHTYPNSDTTNSEDLGRLPLTFTIKMYTGIISDPNEYYTRRNALEGALAKKGPGRLIHPTYGTLNVQLNGTYTINENIARLGQATFTATFTVVDREEDYLKSDPGSDVSITNGTISINDAVADVLDDMKDISTQGAWDSVLNATNAVLEFATNTLPLVRDADKYNALNILINEIEIFYNQKVGTIGVELTSLLDLIEESITDPSDRFNAYKSLFTFYDEEVSRLVDPTTQELLAIDTNTRLFRNFTQTQAVTHASNSVTDIDFQTETELDSVASDMFSQYDKVQQLQSGESSIYNDLQQQRVDFNDFIKDKEQTVLRVETVTVANSSLTTLVHDYYGNQDNYDLIKDLNGFTDPSLLNGEVLIVAGG
jgi:prophage DNA circulation protein